MPDRFGVTWRFMLLRCAERFGQNPARFIESLDAGEEAEMIAYERVRQHQEAEELRAVIASGGVRL